MTSQMLLNCFICPYHWSHWLGFLGPACQQELEGQKSPSSTTGIAEWPFIKVAIQILFLIVAYLNVEELSQVKY